ncbi:hypothetical protein RRG08_002173 [Elysia crispata]|uniref:Uncharacterized protein n=1 Tax=Elysia crispata TaxID=231223 RepID=A0AAE0ZCJ8_9GAST|nr:hypothetical protein RRG08_002173 [Elysia crispata]
MDTNWWLKEARVCIWAYCALILLSCLNRQYLSGAYAQIAVETRANACGGSPFVAGHSHRAFLEDSLSSEEHDDEEIQNVADHSCSRNNVPPSTQVRPPTLSTNEAITTRSNSKPASGDSDRKQASPGNIADARKKDCGKKKYKGSKRQRKKNKKKKMGKKKKRS